MTDEEETGWRSYEARFERAEAAAAAFQAHVNDPGVHRRVGATGPVQPMPDMVAILAFEEQWPNDDGKDEAINRTFRIRSSRYYQTLLRVIDTPEALEHNPVLVHRLRERRDRRVQARASRTFLTR